MAKRVQQLSLDLRKRGGRRPGAGRPRGPFGGRLHEKRPRITGREPLHVTIKLRSGRPSLRQKTIWKVFSKVAERARTHGLQIAHFALLSNHAHFLVEAPNQAALTAGLKSLTISLAKALNRLGGLSGRVLLDRYHLHVLKTPREVRHALRYVLTNEAHHARSKTLYVDAFSSLALSLGQAALRGLLREFRISIGPVPLPCLQNALNAICLPPRTWLLARACSGLGRMG